MDTKLTWLIIFCLASVVFCQDAVNSTNLRDIMRGDVNISFYLEGVKEVKEADNTVTFNGKLLLEWKGLQANWSSVYILTQNGSKYKSSETHWAYAQARLLLSNARTFSGQGRIGELRSMALTHHENGHVIGVVDFEEPSTCLFDLTEFPSDTQHCYLDFIKSVAYSNVYAGEASYIGDLKGNEIFKNSTIHEAWEVKDISISEVIHDWFVGSKYQKIYHVKPQKYVRVSITIKRSSQFLHKLYITPVALVLLTPIIFLLPPDSDQKLIYGALLLLIQYQTTTALEKYFALSQDQTPYVVSLMSSCGGLIFSCLFLSALLSSIERVGREKPLPAFVKRYIIGTIGPLLCVKSGEESESTVHISNVKCGDQAKIVNQEQLSENFTNQNGGDTISSDMLEQNTAIMALVHELKLARYHKRHNEQWTNFFTVINRILFLITMIVAVVLLLCYIGV